MSETRTLEIPVEVYEAVTRAAQASGTSVAEFLGQKFGVAGGSFTGYQHATGKEESALGGWQASLPQRRAFLKLPLEERRRILAAQAQNAVPHYEHNSEWRDLGPGDLVEY